MRTKIKPLGCLALAPKLTVPGLGLGMSLLYPLKVEFSNMLSIIPIEQMQTAVEFLEVK